MEELKIHPVTSSNVETFVHYCLQHGPEHDDSYVPGPGFSPSPDQPSYLLIRNGDTVGTVSLLRTRRYAEAGRGRFAVLHSTLGSREAYSALLTAVRVDFEGLQGVYLFLPQTNKQTAGILAELGFQIERYSFVLINRAVRTVHLQMPNGLSIRSLQASDSQGIDRFAECVNASFSGLAGHMDLAAEEVKAWFLDRGYLEKGVCLLQEGDLPVGTISISREYGDERIAEIGALGVIESHRGRGFGRLLLRYGLDFSLRGGFESVILSVNAENRSALKLYESEGFEVIETVVCFNLDTARSMAS